MPPFVVHSPPISVSAAAGTVSATKATPHRLPIFLGVPDKETILIFRTQLLRVEHQMSTVLQIRPPVLPPTHNEFSIESSPFFILGNQPFGPTVVRRFAAERRGKMLAANVCRPGRVQRIVGKFFTRDVRGVHPFKPFLKGIVAQDLHLFFVQVDDVFLVFIRERTPAETALATVGKT